jgi:UDP-N-acetylglucosamine--dolichyl-phosphate N-acetylglucosaminephosphotransferase
MITILSTILLGFTDDMIDLAWRFKLIFPFFFMVPIIRAFSGSTFLIIPFPFSYIIGETLDLGVLFSLYIILLGVYFTNTINIYAGINGLEVGTHELMQGRAS